MSEDINNPVKLLQKLILVAQNKDKDKKPHNIKIKNNNPKEPKIKEDKRFSAKQKYRVYKTKIEPKLHSKITIDEEDDIVAELKKAFDNRDKDTTNLVETSGLPEYENRRTSFGGLSAIDEISGEDAENITGFNTPTREEQDLVDKYLYSLRKKRELKPKSLIEDFLLTDNNYASSRIQAGIRRRLAQQEYNAKNESASKLQSAIIRKSIENELKLANKSATKIQEKTREFLKRNKEEKIRLKNEAFASLREEPTYKPERRNSFSGKGSELSQADTLEPTRRRGRPTNASKGLPTKQPPKIK